MLIKRRPLSKPEQPDIKWGLDTALACSRFTAVVQTFLSGDLSITQVRLREVKHYCGQHPGPCQANGQRRHRRARYLEGADWVGFNDLVNDVLDRLGADVTVSSTVCVIRKGRQRRWRYDYGRGRGPVGQADWDRTGTAADYVDACGQAPPESVYPDGTPGLAGYKEVPA